MPSISPKVNVVILNSINCDGTGDFSHLVGIYHALKKNTITKRFRLSFLICNQNSGSYKKIEDALKNLTIPHSEYFYGTPEDYENSFHQKKEIQSRLANSHQIIQISFHNFPAIKKYHPYFNPDALLKYVGEHESHHLPIPVGQKKWSSYVMGLGDKRYGIKLENLPRITPSAAFSILEKNDPDFANQLLFHTQSLHAEIFNHANYLIPVYINQITVLVRFIYLLAANKKMDTKNIALKLSGLQDASKLAKVIELEKIIHFKDKNIKQIEIINRGANEINIISLNPLSERVMRIFVGFDLSLESFNTLFQSTFIAAVSGDNTFEKAISSEVLPFYVSSTFVMKQPTLTALATIINQASLDIDPAIKADFITYWSQISTFSSHFIRKDLVRRLYSFSCSSIFMRCLLIGIL